MFLTLGMLLFFPFLLYSSCSFLFSFLPSKYGTFACLDWRCFVNVARVFCAMHWYDRDHSGQPKEDGIEMFTLDVGLHGIL